MWENGRLVCGLLNIHCITFPGIMDKSSKEMFAFLARHPDAENCQQELRVARVAALEAKEARGSGRELFGLLADPPEGLYDMLMYVGEQCLDKETVTKLKAQAGVAAAACVDAFSATLRVPAFCASCARACPPGILQHILITNLFSHPPLPAPSLCCRTP